MLAVPVAVWVGTASRAALPVTPAALAVAGVDEASPVTPAALAVALAVGAGGEMRPRAPATAALAVDTPGTVTF